MNMCQPKQVGCIAGEDVKLAGKETDKKDKEGAEDNLAEQEASQKRKRGATVTGEEFDDGVEKEEELNDPDEIHGVGKKRRRGNSGKIILEIDPRKIVEQTTATSDRLGLSSRQTAMMLAAVVKAGGGDLSQVPISKSAVHVKRKKSRFQKGKEIQDSFIPSDTGYILHYDTKLVNPKGRDTEDRAAVLYSGGIHKQPYLLGIPRFLSSAGRDVEAGVIKELEKYKIPMQVQHQKNMIV